MTTEKTDHGVTHVEHTHDHHGHQANYDAEDIKGRDFTLQEDQIPPGYFKSVGFLGSMVAVSVMFMCGQGGFSFIAPVIGQINADIGPDPNITWLSLSYLLTTSVGLIIVGRVTDLFGRRWWFIGSCVVGTIGSIVSATAPDVPALIAGVTLIGIAASVQLSYAFGITELVPMKYRFLASAWIFFGVIPVTGFGPIVSYSFIYSTSTGWRGIFYMMIALNVTATILLYLFYHPPTFGQKHDPNRKWEFIKNFDYIGMLLVTAGLMLFIMGINWGAELYPWKSAHVISTMIIGFFLIVAFFLWEIYGNLKEPLLPISLFSNRGWFISTLLWGTGSALYYSCAILWPSMISALYAPGHGWVRNGLLASIQGSAIILGEFTSAMLKRNTNWQLIILFPLVGIILACMATCTADTVVRSSIFMFLASYWIGWCEMINSNVSSIVLDDQREIGTAVGTGGSARSFFASIGAAIFTTVLITRTTVEITARMPAALANTGINATAIPTLITAISTNPSGDFTTIPGVTKEIAAVGLRAYQDASSSAFGTVFLSTIAFSGISAILAVWAPNVNHKLTKELSTPIQGKRGVGMQQGVEV